MKPPSPSPARRAAKIFGAPGLVTATLVLCFFLPRIASASTDRATLDTDATEVVHLLDYVGADYGGAVQNGQVKNADELKEQVEVLEEAGRVAARLARRGASKGFDGRAAVLRVLNLVVAHRPEAEVTDAVKEVRAGFAAFYDLPEAPHEPPSHERGQALYELHCATCHGAQGRADTPRAAEYTPRPANFHDPRIAGSLSPRRTFTTVRFGVPNTAMVPFDFLSDKDRWDLAFYVSELDHPGRTAAPIAQEAMFDLRELAMESDDELRDGLRRAGVEEGQVEGALANLRLRAPYDPAIAYPKGAALRVLRARASLRKVERQVLRGDLESAKTLLLSAYLEEVEPLEASLRAADPALVQEIEGLFKEVRGDIDRLDPRPSAPGVPVPAREIESKLEALSVSLGRAGHALAGSGGRPSFFTTAISSAGIALREGAEAALLIAALLAVVGRAGQPERKRWVHFGWLCAAAAGALTWLASRWVVEMSGLGRETLEGMSALLAAVVLFYVSYWLFAKREAARWVAYLKTKASSGRAAASLFGISFLAVYREAFETVIFYQAIVSEPEATTAAGIGALLGMALLVGLVVAYGRAGKFAPPRSFFAFSTLLLYGLCIVFAGQGIAALQTTGLLPLHPVRLPQLPSLGVYPTIETYAVQTALIGLAVVAFFLRKAPSSATSHPPGRPSDATPDQRRV